MESEKVKEIKNALEYAIQVGLDKFSLGASLSDCLTLINESEEENIGLKNQKKEFLSLISGQENIISELGTENQHLKDRIAELEKENKKLFDSVESVQNDRCVYKCELTKKHLKQFAEMLKEKAKNLKLGSVEVHNFLWVNDIDETLKDMTGGVWN